MTLNKQLAGALALIRFAACGRPAPPPTAVAPPPEPRAPGEATVEVLWDSWGIPHIYGQDLPAALYAFGWAQMRSHGNLLLRLYGQARGRAAEYWGERYLDSDIWVWTNGIPGRAEQWLEAQHPQERSALVAFVAGINAYGQLHPDSLAPEVRQVLPVQPADVLAHLNRVLHFTFLVSASDMASLAREWGSPGIPSSGRAASGRLRSGAESPARRAGAPLSGRAASGRLRSGAESPARRGSNGWAIAPAHSASGHALLLANPHLPWGDLFTWYEAQLSAPDLDIYGAALVGTPLPGIAFNDSLGWALTTNTIDAADVYQLELRGDGYIIDGTYQPFQNEQQRLRVRGDDGDIRSRTLRIRRSSYGPLIADNPRYGLALHVAGLDQPHLLGQLLDMGRAHNLQQFEAAVARLQLPLFTIIYADARGHILSAFNGQVPVRPQGDARYWAGIVAGNTAATLWTDTYQYWQLPRVVDPPTGWVQNANDPPWTTTLPPLDYNRFPPALAPPPTMSFRAQRSVRMLAEDSLVTFDELVAYKHSTYVEMADHILEDVVHAARTWGGGDARPAADVLERWDRQANATSRGAVLFQAFSRLLLAQPWASGSPYDVPWTLHAPLATPDGLSDPRLAASLLERAAAEVRARYGRLDVAWGDVYRLRRDGLDLPASGGLGSFRNFTFEAADSTRFVVTGGDSYVAAVEFASPVRARAVLGYGNASQPGSPHRTDQLPLVAGQRLREVWLTRGEVEANLRDREFF